MMSDVSSDQNEEKFNKKDDADDIRTLLKLNRPPISLDSNSFSGITKLDFGGCGLKSFPDSMPNCLPNLSILFCPNNNFSELPAIVGSCPKLQMVSFKSNRMKTIHPDALQSQLRWLILTDNILESIPSTIGRCKILQKLMLSGNNLTSIPFQIKHCDKLELVRLASNRLKKPPIELLRIPTLAWVALSGNPFLPIRSNDVTVSNLKTFHDPVLEDVENGVVLGRGASGITRQISWNDTSVAVKQYFGTMTSDGDPADERFISLIVSSLDNENLIRVHGQTSEGSLVMELLKNYSAFGNPPSFITCSRDVYVQDATVTPVQAIGIVTGLLSVLNGIHSLGICHGDFYGHNILLCDHDSTKFKLSDFGAAFLYDRTAQYGKMVELIEMRAFGHLVTEITALLNKESIPEKIQLEKLATACLDTTQSFSSLNIIWTALTQTCINKKSNPLFRPIQVIIAVRDIFLVSFKRLTLFPVNFFNFIGSYFLMTIRK